tara:strand:+ start:979 stop:1290 length:312 start_codon:yes stop_codon:yes gene_type:complete
MNNSTNFKVDQLEEYFGWGGNFIFIGAQMFQIIHTFKIKTTRDLSYGLQILMIIGNSMYTVFGIIDKSFAMFLGSLITVIMNIIQICQKIYYDKRYNTYDLIN